MASPSTASATPDSAANPLQQRGNPVRRANLADEIHVADIDAELERRGRDDDPELPGLEAPLRREAHPEWILVGWGDINEAGRIRHHLKNNIGDVNNLVLFIGYCAEHTLGAQIQSGKPKVNIFGEPYEVRARVASLDSFSGHADKSELQDYVKKIGGNIKKIFVIHGEEQQALAFGETLRKMKPNAKVVVPEYKQIEEV